jgi:dihydroflavonol-4-reductase
MRPAVIGGSGFIGLHAIDALRDRGADPVAIVRSALPRRTLVARGVPFVRTDAADASALATALRGYDVVVHAAAHYPRVSTDPAGTLRTATEQMRAVLDACAAASVRRLVVVSTTATVAPAIGRASDERDVWPMPPGIGAYHDAKWAMESQALAEDRFEVVVVCPGACLGPLDLRLGTNGLVVAAARGRMPPYADGIVNTVDVRDVGAAIARLVDHPEPPRRVLLVGGDQRLSALLAEVAARYGAATPDAPVSAEAAIASADAEEASGRRASLPREFVDLVLHASPIDASLATRTLGLRWTPLADTLDAFDAWARAYALVPHPRPGDRSCPPTPSNSASLPSCRP